MGVLLVKIGRQMSEGDCDYTDPHAYVEQNAGLDEAFSTSFGPFDTPVRIRITHYRKVLADADGPNAKWALDGIVKLGILRDDSTVEIESITPIQVQSDVEKTVFEIFDEGEPEWLNLSATDAEKRNRP